MKNDGNTIRNQGLSLTELIVAVAVLALAMSGIIGMINIASRYYANSSKEVEVQDQLQKTFTIVSNLMVGANDGVESFSGSSGEKFYVFKKSTKKYMVAARGEEVYVGSFSSTAGNDAMKNSIFSSENLLVNHVTSFSINDTHYSQGYLVLSMGIQYGSRVASMTKNVYLRTDTSDYDNIIEKCDITCSKAEEEASGKNQLTFKVKQTAEDKIAKNTVLTIVVRLVPKAMALSSSTVSITGDVTMQSVTYNQNLGVAVFKATLKTDWAKNAEKEIKVQYTKGAKLDLKVSYITGLGK